MTRAFFNEQFAALVNAFIPAQRLTAESQDVYWAMLQDIPAREFGQGVRKCLATSKFFPTISELGEASLPNRTVRGRYNPHGESIRVVTWDQQVKEVQRRLEKRHD